MLGTVISSQAKVKQMHKWIVKINGQMVKKKKKDTNEWNRSPKN